MIIDCVQHAGWLSNTWLVAGREEGRGLIIDPGVDPPRTLEMVRRHGVRIVAVICTHRHYVHTVGAEAVSRNLQSPVLAHPLEKPHIATASATVEPGHRFEFNGWAAEVVHVPGHTAGQIALLIPDVGLFTGDALFKGSVGSTVHPGSTGLEDLRTSVLEKLLIHPGELTIYPGHGQTTTVEAELNKNPFVRTWRGVDAPGSRPARVDGKRVAIEVWARDYDGGHKAQVRYANGQGDVVSGSKVQKVTL